MYCFLKNPCQFRTHLFNYQLSSVSISKVLVEYLLETWLLYQLDKMLFVEQLQIIWVNINDLPSSTPRIYYPA